MKNYHYAVVTRPLDSPSKPEFTHPDMESVDYKRQPDVHALRGAVDRAGGLTCGIFRGGMFGLRTNEISILSVWPNLTGGQSCLENFVKVDDLQIHDQQNLIATVRPSEALAIKRPGIYVIRWITMRAQDIGEYTELCLKTWPRFEIGGTQRCYGIFRPTESTDVRTLLMLTWYEDLSAWEDSRQLDPRDKHLWIRRSQMELSHWAEAGRLAV
ncbi:MAG: hypothetical protein ACR2QW_15230 [bacterium]